MSYKTKTLTDADISAEPSVTRRSAMRVLGIGAGLSTLVGFGMISPAGADITYFGTNCSDNDRFHSGPRQDPIFRGRRCSDSDPPLSRRKRNSDSYPSTDSD
jgi:hypothetical protein